MKKPNRRFVTFRKAAAAAAVVFLYRDAHAQLFQDGFNYTSGSNLAGNGAWTGGNANLTIGSGSLSYSGPPSLGGNSLSVNSGVSAGSSVANFNSSGITTGSVYYSFLAECTTLPNSGNAYLTSLLPTAATGPNGSGDPLAFYAGSVTGSSTTFRVGIRSGPTAALFAPNNANFTVGAVNLFVIEYTFGGNANLWINPTAGNASPPTADLSITEGVVPTDLREIGFKAQSAATVGNWVFDDVRVGTSWTDVTPTSAVPEPSSFVLAGLGILGLAARLRSKAKRG